MSRLEKALKELQEAVKESSYDTTTAFEVFITAQSCEITIKNRSPESLRNENVAMRNIRGQFIK